MANIFVTGGTGFMGSHIVELLVQQGHQVTVLTSSSSIHPNIQHLQAQIKIVRGDFGNYQLVLEHLKKHRYHCPYCLDNGSQNSFRKSNL